MPPMHVEKQEYIIRNYISLLNTSPLAQRLPQLIIRDWCHYMNWKFGNRMNEISTAGMKAAIMTVGNGTPRKAAIRKAVAPMTGGMIWLPVEAAASMAAAISGL